VRGQSFTTEFSHYGAPSATAPEFFYYLWLASLRNGQKEKLFASKKKLFAPL